MRRDIFLILKKLSLSNKTVSKSQHYLIQVDFVSLQTLLGLFQEQHELTDLEQSISVFSIVACWVTSPPYLATLLLCLVCYLKLKSTSSPWRSYSPSTRSSRSRTQILTGSSTLISLPCRLICNAIYSEQSAQWYQAICSIISTITQSPSLQSSRLNNCNHSLLQLQLNNPYTLKKPLTLSKQVRCATQLLSSQPILLLETMDSTCS